ncbi:MAG TPA: hypothetical protein PK250_00460 [Syntrophobacter fumaroxidans]|nr:hypothetical protein [Syntrophobacter fumaroxidans]
MKGFRPTGRMHRAGSLCSLRRIIILPVPMGRSCFFCITEVRSHAPGVGRYARVPKSLFFRITLHGSFHTKSPREVVKPSPCTSDRHIGPHAEAGTALIPAPLIDSQRKHERQGGHGFIVPTVLHWQNQTNE